MIDLPIAISSTASTIIAALAGLLGAVIGAGAGGYFTLRVQRTTDRFQRETAADEKRRLAAATALLIQDDFLHYQATLARALDRWTWWRPEELLAPQATIEDRKIVWASLDDEKTTVVAGAQGWMDYLIAIHALQPAGPVVANLSDLDAQTMKDTFRALEEGREALADLAGREFHPFSMARVLDQLKRCKTVAELLNGPPMLTGKARDASDDTPRDCID